VSFSAWAVRDGDVEPVDVCEGDLDKDGDGDANDVMRFLDDFGRSPFFNPCPDCVAGTGCNYGSCMGGYCGEQALGGWCWCDANCVNMGDCCQDACSGCGYCP
jgi:hypothetical protein